MSKDWSSYDSAAATHNRLGVPSMFAAPAQDLAARMDLTNARTALDVGAGSGVVACAMAKRTSVVATDPSTEMLRLARENGIAAVVASSLPRLPFGDGRFDRVTAGFVLSHVASYRESLAEMARMLRPGGKLGVTAWSCLSNPFRDHWDALVERFVDAEALHAATRQWLPWEDWLSDAGNLRAALEEAGMRDVTVEEIEYPIHITIADFLAIREQSGTARFLRTVLDAEEWERFRALALAEFRARFRDPIDHTRRALIAVGRRG